MDLKLKGKTAIVTGGTGGIGLAIARALAAEGVEVTVPGRSQQTLDNAFDGEGLRVRKVVVDVGTAPGVATLIAAVPETDILVNNVGIYEAKPFAEVPDEDWFRLFEVNVMSGVRLSRHYLPKMLAKNDGRVIFISSDSAVMTHPEMMPYGMTKSSQLAISRGMAEMTKGTRVTVNTVMPGPTRSVGLEVFLQSIASKKDATRQEAEKEMFEKHRPTSLLQRLIESDEIAHLVAYLASPLSSATNGAALRAEGGLLPSIL